MVVRDWVSGGIVVRDWVLLLMTESDLMLGPSDGNTGLSKVNRWLDDFFVVSLVSETCSRKESRKSKSGELSLLISCVRPSCG